MKRELRKSRRAHFAVIRCSDFRLQAVVRRMHALPDPVVLIDDSKRQSVLLCCNEVAVRYGIEAGMKTVQAMARCPDLRVESPSAPAETQASRLLLETALGWVPGVEETELGCLTLDLSTQPAEKWEESARRTRGLLYEKGVEVTIGLGETPSLARVAALAGATMGESVWVLKPEQRMELLHQLPLGVGEVEDRLCERLRLWGINTLGSFVQLQREEIATRLGEEGVALWLRLQGKMMRPLRFAKFDELFEERHAFDHEISEREPLLFVVNRFLDSLIERVGAVGRAAAAVNVLLLFVDGSCHAKRLAMPEPSLEHEILFHLISGHMEGLKMKAPIEELRLRFEPTEVVATQRALFGAGLKNRFCYEETIKRLRRIVGSDSVGSPRPCDTHRPGAFSLVPLLAELGEASEGIVESGEGGENLSSGGQSPVTGVPIRRFRAGVRVRVVMREGLPIRIESSDVKGAVVAFAGPWYMTGEWWDGRRKWNRLEWDVEVEGQGVFRIVQEGGEWELEGKYG